MKRISKLLRNSAPSSESNGATYTVGYGKPPQHGRFRPGRSGNPAGRPRGVHNLQTDVRRTLKAPVKVKEGERSSTMSTQASVLMMLREKALRGEARALDRLVKRRSKIYPPMTRRSSPPMPSKSLQLMRWREPSQPPLP